MDQAKNQAKAKPRILRILWSRSNNLSPTATFLFSDCVGVAAARTREYLAFADPENKFQPSPSALREIFLMTYLQRSSQLHLADTLTCTAMTPEQRVLLGADWVWAVLDLPSRNPKIQIAVQVLHVLQEPEANTTRSDAHVEILHMASTATVERTRAERLVGFCSAVGWSCFALFLFFGFGSDPGNICGLLSNNLHAAVGKCVRVDQTFVQSFFRGAKHFVTAAGMVQAVVSAEESAPLTMLVKFT
ncbi:rab15 effector protein [Electrophorus electricus]|uniref:rab15 effector protein n=1 Tax=Electrophorus electricus TaxID=8005 RepID=UPI0015CF82A0|nr:rab15 effector protein [Electrophorus electricus]